MREPVALLAVGDDDVRVMQEPVDGRGRHGLWHQFVEPRGVDVGADRDRAFLVGGVDDSEQRVGGVGGNRQQSDIVDQDEV